MAIPSNTGQTAPDKAETARNEWVSAVGGVVALGYIAFLFIFDGAPVRLTCQRAEPAGTVDCVRQAWVLGIIPLRQERIEGVRGASVEKADEAETYRVALLTATGSVPLRAFYTYDRGPTEETADRINAFVQSNEAGTLTLTLTLPGRLSSGNWFLTQILLLILTVIWGVSGVLRLVGWLWVALRTWLRGLGEIS